MNFAIYVNNNWQPVQVEIAPRLVKAFDTTNDSFSCLLKANTTEMPYKPMTPFRITDDDNKNTILWVINDTVSVFSLDPVCYKHNLSLVQYRYFLNKHLVRNTVFNQPRQAKQEMMGATSCELMAIPIEQDSTDLRVDYQCITGQLENDNVTLKQANYWTDKMGIGSHTKVKKFTYRYELYGIINPGKVDTHIFDDYNKLIKVTSLDNTNAQFNSNFSWEVFNVTNGDFIVSIPNASNLDTDLASDSIRDAINTYLSNHMKVILGVRVADSNATQPYTYWDFTFAKTIVNHDDYSEGNMYHYDRTKYEYLTLHIIINVELYNYTFYDVLDTLLKQYRLYSSSQLYKRDRLFYLPRKTGYDDQDEKDLYDLLTTTYPPDTLNLTQATFYDALTEIFRFYDAGFKFDENRRIQIEYYNDPQEDRTDDLIDEGLFIASGKQLSHADKNFNNGRVAYYQNAVIPIKTRMDARSRTLGVPALADFGILLQKPIYYMSKITIDVYGTFQVYGQGLYQTLTTYTTLKLDLTPFIVNEQEYTALNKNDANVFSANGTDIMVKYQINTLHYNRGGNFIPLGETYTDYDNQTRRILLNVFRWAYFRFFGYGFRVNIGSIWDINTPYIWTFPPVKEFENQHFLIEYLTQNNGRAKLETTDNKYKGEQVINQNDGLIDLNKMGINAFGESLKDGEPILTLQCQITDWNNRIKEGDYFIKDNRVWVANVVNYTVIKDGVYSCSVEFSKNFNALSMRVRSDNQKRLTNISSDAATLSEDNFTDYVYVCNPSNIGDYAKTSTILNVDLLQSMVGQTFGKSASNYTYKNVDFAYITSYDINGNLLKYGDNNSAERKYMPMIKYGFGNSVCFEVQFESPLSAGNQLVVGTGYFGNNTYFSQARLYTDDEGWADTISLSFCEITEKGEREKFMNYPDVDSSTNNRYQIVGTISSLDYYKKPNEIFALNYEWCFLSVDPQNIFIGTKFINVNAFVDKIGIKGKKFYVMYGNEKYSILDTKGKGTKVAITDVIVSKSTNYIRLGFNLGDSISPNCWSIVDENEDIYFASNIKKLFSTAGLYQLGFFTNKNRNDY